jgi:hypothetical protein
MLVPIGSDAHSSGSRVVHGGWPPEEQPHSFTRHKGNNRVSLITSNPSQFQTDPSSSEASPPCAAYERPTRKGLAVVAQGAATGFPVSGTGLPSCACPDSSPEPPPPKARGGLENLTIVLSNQESPGASHCHFH